MKKVFFFKSAIAFILAGAMIGLSSCKKEITSPALTTADITEITQSGAVSGGDVTTDGGSAITARGICWSTEENPFPVFKTDEGTGIASYASNITGLLPNTVYYVRAYAYTQDAVGFGNEVSFTTNPMQIIFKSDMNYGSLSDIEGNTYKTIQIGTQTWMAENLKTTKLNDGTGLQNPKDWSTWTKFASGDKAASSYIWYSRDVTKCQGYGALYNWTAVSSGKLCPVGWHVPEMSEWITLVSFLGGKDVAGGKLKEEGKTHWSFPNNGGTNESGFTALPAGTYNSTWSRTDNFKNIGEFGGWWSKTAKISSKVAGCLHLLHDLPKVVTMDTVAAFTEGKSVRCVKD